MIHQKATPSIVTGVKQGSCRSLRSVSDHPANSTFAVLFPEATIEGSEMSCKILWGDLLPAVSVQGSNCPLGLKPHANRTTDMVREVSDWRLRTSKHMEVPGVVSASILAFLEPQNSTSIYYS